MTEELERALRDGLISETKKVLSNLARQGMGVQDCPEFKRTILPKLQELLNGQNIGSLVAIQECTDESTVPGERVFSVDFGQVRVSIQEDPKLKLCYFVSSPEGTR